MDNTSLTDPIISWYQRELWKGRLLNLPIFDIPDKFCCLSGDEMIIRRTMTTESCVVSQTTTITSSTLAPVVVTAAAANQRQQARVESDESNEMETTQDRVIESHS